MVILFLTLMINQVDAGYPDGTVVFSYKNGLVGRIAKRITGGDQYTHVGVVINNKVYESDWPRTKATPVNQYGKRRTTNDYYVPLTPYSGQEVQNMRAYADSQIGTPYRLRNYFHPNTKKTNGTWCSPFVGRILNRSGRFNLSEQNYHEPQNIKNNLHGYGFSRRVVK